MKKIALETAKTTKGSRYPAPYDEPCGGRWRRCVGDAAGLLEVGTRRPEEDAVFYPDIDLQVLKGRAGFAHRDGQLYPGSKPRDPVTGK